MHFGLCWLACALTGVAPAPGRLTRAVALEQVAVHACFTAMNHAHLPRGYQDCLRDFQEHAFLDAEDVCAKEGVLAAALPPCQKAVAQFVLADARGDLPGALTALIKARSRCSAAVLCPAAAPPAAPARPGPA